MVVDKCHLLSVSQRQVPSSALHHSPRPPEEIDQQGQILGTRTHVNIWPNEVI